MMQLLCVDWRMALRCIWYVNNRTHCNTNTSLSNKVLLILSLRKSYIKFNRNCLSCQSNIYKIIYQVSIYNLMSNSCNKL